MQRVLIRGTNWVGDSVMSVAALREVRRHFPGSHLTLLARSWVCGLFENQGLLDEIITLEEGRQGLAQLRALRSRAQAFDTALLFQNAFRAALLAFAAGIPERIGYRTDARGFLLTRRASPRIKPLGRHQVFYYLDLLYQTGLSSVNYLTDSSFRPDIRLRPTTRAHEEADSLLEQTGMDRLRPLVMVNPGAHFGPAKRWFTDRYALLGDRLIRERGAEVAIIGSAQELQIAEEIRSLMKEQPRVLAGRTSLAGLMGLLSRCRLLITNDSGPMHLAAALDVPQIALFGSTDERATGPLSHNSTVIHKHVECSPCLLRECPIDLRCFDRIKVEEVYGIAWEILSRAL